jgi:formamidopyrimidine-DNA glycosylase
MPEAPEVKRFVDSISKFIGENCSISSLDVISGRYVKEDISGAAEFRSLLPLKIKEVCCKGKFIYWKFEDRKSVV